MAPAKESELNTIVLLQILAEEIHFFAAKPSEQNIVTLLLSDNNTVERSEAGSAGNVN